MRSSAGATHFSSRKCCHPQTIEVGANARRPLGIQVTVANHETFPFTDKVFGVLLQYPTTEGAIIDYEPFIKSAHAAGALAIVAADLLALALVRPPGEMGADVAVGSSRSVSAFQLGCGGPHAAYFATRDQYKRHLPGRLVGVSHDAAGRPAYRLALQTREQHIPPRQSDEQHLHGAGAARGHGLDVCGLSWTRRIAENCPPRA